MVIKLRKLTRKDWDFVLKLRNRREYRDFFYHQNPISKSEHYNYMKKQQNNSNYVCWIITYNDEDVGFIRILDNDISIAIEKKYHGKGIGSKTIKLVEKEAKKLGIKRLVGRVMIQNEISKKIFLKNNYQLKMYWYEKEISKVKD